MRPSHRIRKAQELEQEQQLEQQQQLVVEWGTKRVVARELVREAPKVRHDAVEQEQEQELLLLQVPRQVQDSSGPHRAQQRFVQRRKRQLGGKELALAR